MKVEEICEKLRTVVGEKADRLHRLYLREDHKGKGEIEAAINPERA